MKEVGFSAKGHTRRVLIVSDLQLLCTAVHLITGGISYLILFFLFFPIISEHPILPWGDYNTEKVKAKESE